MLGRHRKVREQSAPETAPMGKIPLPETGEEKGMCLEGRQGPLASECTDFASSYSHFQGLLERNKMVRSCLTFSTPQTLLDFGERGAGGKTKMNK